MSEKRFTLMENISAYDGRVISEYVLDNEKRLTFEEVVDLLNSLVDENEQLRHQMRVLSAHLLSDECALTDSQIRKIKEELGWQGK